MTKRRAKNKNYRKNLKVWTILCLLLICTVAILLRGIVVYRLYPLEFKEQIERYSDMYSIDKYFVSAVICTESHFDEKIISNKGAVGLMQIMPNTGEWAAKLIGIEDYSVERLTNPEININIGCWYLSYLGEMFEGDAQKVLAAYNAGPANVKEWLEMDGSLTEIPYEETENYLQKVQRNYEIYKGLYNIF
ncbi:MAG: lytic transglycosylase domain-containing protein [Christensenellales bacterium]|jgi:soluble lytic murein transglycosylase